MIKIFDNISPTLVSAIYYAVLRDNTWKFDYPPSFSFHDRFAKMDIINSKTVRPILSGLAVGLLSVIYDSDETKYFDPSFIGYCGVSLKDKGLGEDNLHTDHTPESEATNMANANLPYDPTKLIKLVGVLNPDWTKEDGGTFQCGGEEVEMKPGRFVLFNPRELHRAGNILGDKKRIAIDLAVNPI
tara:strand:+ start:737 stop:1294 length:558 start_codon:yes stop_codon:yes gene_type:complete